MKKSPPRYFWRRFFAYIIDYPFVGFVVAWGLFPFINGHTDQIRLGVTSFTTHKCTNGKAISPEMVELLGRDFVPAVVYCQRRIMGVNTGMIAHIILEHSRTKTGIVTREKTISTTNAVDDHARPIFPVYPDVPIFLFVLIVGEAWFLTNSGGQTPGKMLLKIQVIYQHKQDALRREFFKHLPHVVFVILSSVMIIEPASIEGFTR